MSRKGIKNRKTNVIINFSTMFTKDDFIKYDKIRTNVMWGVYLTELVKDGEITQEEYDKWSQPSKKTLLKYIKGCL